MPINTIIVIFIQLFNIVALIGLIYLFMLMVKALRKYIKSSDIRKEKSIEQKSLGNAIREHRLHCKMTQEFVAESLGVSRQAVSKWESGTSDPSTSNLLALAKLFHISAAELLHEVNS